MLIIRKDLERGVRVKTKSSIRRVPLDASAIETVKQVHEQLKTTNVRTYGRYLNDTIRKHFTDKRLVLHSCRHTYKTFARACGLPADVSDEISGHSKSTVSAVSDGYGEYPDEVLLKANQKIWDYLYTLV